MAEEDKEGVPSSRLSVIDIGKRMKKIFLHGKLGERFGRTWKLNVGSPTEAINALFANEPLIEKYLNKKQQEGISYGIKKHKSEGFMAKEEYGLLSSSDIHIFPIPEGAAAFAVSLLIAVATTAASMYISKKMAEAMERDDSTVAIQTKSYLFEGGKNRLQQGGTVPLGYGRLKVGSNVISSCVVNYDYDSDKGEIFNFNSGLYSLVPEYSQYYNRLAGGLGSAFLLNISDGPSKFNAVDPAFQLLKGATSKATFGYPGTYGASWDADAASKFSYGKWNGQTTREGSLFAGYFFYTSHFGEGVDTSMLTNWVEEGENGRFGNWYPETEEDEKGIGQWYPYRVPQDKAENSSFVAMQSIPQQDNGSNSPKFFYPITFSDVDIPDVNVGDSQNRNNEGIFPIQVGQRWIGGRKKDGLGWFKLESAAVYKSIDLIGEGPIEGFSNKDGDSLKFQKNANPNDTNADNYLQGIYLDDTQLKEINPKTKAQSYNINEFDVDIGMNASNLIGAEDQKPLEPQYLFTANSKTIGKQLFGPRLVSNEAIKANASPSEVFERNTAYPKGTLVLYQGDTSRFTYKIARDLSRVFEPSPEEKSFSIYNKGDIVFFDPEEDGIGDFYEATDKMDAYETFNGYNAPYVPGDLLKAPNAYGSTSYYEMGPEAEKFLGVFNPEKDYKGKRGSVLMINRGNSLTAPLYRIDEDYDHQMPKGVDEWLTLLFHVGEDGEKSSTAPLDLLYYGSRSNSPQLTHEIVKKVLDIQPKDEVDKREGLWQEIVINGPKDVTNGSSGPGVQGTDREDLGIFIMDGSVADTDVRYSDEEYYESHTVINPLVEQMYITLQVDELGYVYEGDRVEVEYRLGALWSALIGAVVGAGAATSESDVLVPGPPPTIAKGWSYKGLFLWSGVGALVGLAVLKNIKISMGKKIENSGEIWPNRAKFRIKYGNEGEIPYVTDVYINGVATSPYRKDVKIYFPPNLDRKDRTVKVYKLNRERNPVKEGEGAARYKEKMSLAAVTEITPIKLSYPNSVVIGTRVNARDVSSIPTRNYDLKLKKVAVPSNYTPSNRQYDGPWDGLFHGQSTRGDPVPQGSMHWTDNPAWCLYDMISSKRYGVGRFGIKAEDIDRWTLYKIAKYCDEIVPTGYSPKYNRRAFQLNGDKSIKISLSLSYDGADFAGEFNYPQKMLAFYYSDGTYDSIKIKSIDIGAGAIALERNPTMAGECATSIDYPIVEPRYTLNAFLMNSSNAFKLINEFAAIFRTYAYWSNGAINFFQDEKKDPVMLFANNNISREGFSYSSTPKTSRTNSCKIKYSNRYQSFRGKMEHSEDLSSIESNNIIEQSIDGFGITSPGQAQRAADFIIKTANLEAEIISFETSAIGSYLRPGDIISVLDNKRTVGRFVGKVLNIDIAGDGKMAEIDADFPIRAIIDEEDKTTWKKITLYGLSGNQTIGSLDASVDGGGKVTDADIDEMRAGQVGEYIVSNLSNNDTRIKIINNPYSFVTGIFTWAQALYDAQDRGGILATVNNITDQSQVQAVLPSDELAWIGGYHLELPAPERFVWYQPQDCTSDAITYFNWAKGFPDVGDPLETDLSSEVTTDVDEWSISTDSSGALGNYIALSGSVNSAIHGDWVTLSENTGIGYILETKANDSLLKLNGAAGTTFIIDDTVNFANKKEFKVINITEKSNGVFHVQGLQYNKEKFDSIEKGASMKAPESPVIFTEKSIDQPSNVGVTILGPKPGLGIPYGITADWDRVPAAVRYRVQFFDGLVLLGTFEVDNIHTSEAQSYTFRSEFISAGGTYYARVSSVGN